jgi:hypothetical protein
MTTDEIEELRREHAPWAQPWTEAGPNEPPRARPGWLTKALQQCVNNTPISPACFTVDPWHGRGGSAGLSWNGQLLSGKKP